MPNQYLWVGAMFWRVLVLFCTKRALGCQNRKMTKQMCCIVFSCPLHRPSVSRNPSRENKQQHFCIYNDGHINAHSDKTAVCGRMSVSRTIIVNLCNVFDMAAFRARSDFLNIHLNEALKWIVTVGSAVDAAALDPSAADFVHVLLAKSEKLHSHWRSWNRQCSALMKIQYWLIASLNT